MIYKHKVTLATAAGQTSSQTLNVIGGICQQIIVRASNATTKFMVSIADRDGDVVLSYPYQTGELNDWNVAIPMVSTQTVSITNASPDDTFKVILQVNERH